MVVRDRQQLAQLLDERMNNTYSSLTDEQELEPGSSLLKSYLLEAHRPPSRQAVLSDTLRDLLPAIPRASVNVFPADETSLATVEVESADQRMSLYVDSTNARYWVVHSLGESTAVDSVITRIVSHSTALDRAWLPADFLRRVADMGAFRGLGLDYDRRLIPDVDFEAPDAPVESLKMQLWGNKAADILSLLQRHDAFPSETTLSKVKVKYWQDRGVPEYFAVDDVKFDGKITARGTSFQSHSELLGAISDMYAHQVTLIEDSHRIASEAYGDAFTLAGEPVALQLSRPIPDLDVFCDSLFSCGPPFRLWGVPISSRTGQRVVHALDLHVGQPLHVEINPTRITLYLPSGVCGNTVLRFYTNLQHHYDARVQAVGSGGHPIFEF